MDQVKDHPKLGPSEYLSLNLIYRI